MLNFKIIGHVVLEKILKGFTLHRHGNHLGYVTMTKYKHKISIQKQARISDMYLVPGQGLASKYIFSNTNLSIYSFLASNSVK